MAEGLNAVPLPADASPQTAQECCDPSCSDPSCCEGCCDTTTGQCC